MFLPRDDSPSLMLTGEIPRKTSFEKGFPFQYVEKQSGYEIKRVPDPLVRDDQAIAVNVRNNGLVILTGCGLWRQNHQKGLEGHLLK